MNIDERINRLERLYEVMSGWHQPDKQIGNKYQDIMRRIKMIYLRLESIESKCGCKVKFKDDIERRIVELEKQHLTKLHQHHSVLLPSLESKDEKPNQDGLDYLRKAYNGKPSDVKTEHVCRSGGLGACPDCMKPYGEVKTEQTLTSDDTLLVSTVADMISVAEEREVNYDDVAEEIIKYVRSNGIKDSI
jgi:hypothetical protein